MNMDLPMQTYPQYNLLKCIRLAANRISIILSLLVSKRRFANKNSTIKFQKHLCDINLKPFFYSLSMT
ncbi:hypothetical protein HBA_0674 [Sodalis endosymbiont of Henestaris halophilus]|nr:hypothetical protein HBA_0674 [Sodalis endosymbiont of Henestaris halophilus]